MVSLRLDEQVFLQNVASRLHSHTESEGIGTLGERTLHAAIKATLEPRPEHCEVPVGRYVADIRNEQGIIEIQTGSFAPLAAKLSYFLSLGQVELVHPLFTSKQVCWVDPQTGEVSPPRKSPRPDRPWDIFCELYHIKSLLPHPQLHVTLLLLHGTDYRLLNGWSRDRKRGSVRYERIPHALEDTVGLSSPSDYLSLLPALEEPFSCAQLAGACRMTPRRAQRMLYALQSMDLAARTGKQGNRYLYTLNHPKG